MEGGDFLQRQGAKIKAHWPTPITRPVGFQYRVDHAPNDYLGFAVDIGIPAMSLLFGSLWWLVALAAR